MSSLIVVVVLAASIGYFGRDRKFGFWGNFFCTLLFTPLIGLLVLLASDRQQKPDATQS